MPEQFYNFCLGDLNKGYYYLKQTEDSLLSETKFYQDNGELYVNLFRLKLANDRVTAYKYREGKWVDFRSRPETHYPTSAYPLLLPKALLAPYRYISISEHDGSVMGEASLTLEDDELVERVGGKVTRTFVMQGTVPSRINWGGPISYLCGSAQEAVQGSGLKFTL